MPPATAAAAPRWKSAIENAIAKYKNQTVIQIATLDSTRSAEFPTPRVRSHIFRDFLSSPYTPSLPLLLSSTDVRTPKVAQLTASPKAELAWWIDGTQQQFRIIADIYIVPEPTHPLHANFVKALQGAEDGTGLAVFRDLKEDVNVEWEKRRVDMFRTMSAHMKAGWCRPTPGTPLQGGQEEARKWPERIIEPDPDNKDGIPQEEYEEAKRNWEIALGNFALVVIDAVEVDFVELGVVPNRRWLYTKREEGGGVWVWKEEELVP